MINSHKSIPPNFFLVDEATKESIQLEEASAVSLGHRGNKGVHGIVESVGSSF